MIAECKRANPSLSNWCFIKSPYVSRNREYDPYILEHIEVTATGFQSAVGKSYSPASDAYHVAMEIRSDSKGDAEGKGRGGIEDAVAQVCRGLNGFVYNLPNITGSTGTAVGVDLLPVVFTTADLFVVNGDLSTAELSTGNIDLTKHEFEPKEWIVFQYHMSPGLKHELARNLQAKSLSQFLDLEYIRSVPIVSHKGIGAFLWWASNFDLGWGQH